jgi:hypothetical protein
MPFVPGKRFVVPRIWPRHRPLGFDSHSGLLIELLNAKGIQIQGDQVVRHQQEMMRSARHVSPRASVDIHGGEQLSVGSTKAVEITCGCGGVYIAAEEHR